MPRIARNAISENAFNNFVFLFIESDFKNPMIANKTEITANWERLIKNRVARFQKPTAPGTKS